MINLILTSISSFFCSLILRFKPSVSIDWQEISSSQRVNSSFNKGFTFLVILITNMFISSPSLAMNELAPKVFELTKSDIQVIDEKLIWRSLDTHKTPLNFAAIKQLLPVSSPINNTILGSSGAYLAKVSLHNELYLPNTWYINPASNFVDKGIAFWQKSDGSVVKLADFSQFNDDKIPMLMHSQAFSLTAEPYESGVLWLYIEAEEFTHKLDLNIFNESAFYRHQFVYNFITYSSICVMLTLALFSIIIFFRTKQKITLTCAAYIGLMGIGWAAAAGLIDDVFAISWFNTTYAGYLLFPLAIAFACHFTKQLFNCDRDFPKIATLLSTFAKVCLVITLFMPVINFSYAFLIAHIIGFLWLPVSLFVGYIMLHQNDFRAKYYFTGNLFYSLTLTYYMLSHLDIMETVFYPELLVIAALAFDCICISMSLAEWLYLKQRDYNRNFHLARIDPLTEIGNRYALNESLEKIKYDFVIVFIDFDGIKTINDNLGHKQGDELLIEGANLMRREAGNMGTVFRTGGDEFVWLFEIQNIELMAEAVASVPELILRCELSLQEKWDAAGISYGIATSTETKSQSECLTLADDRMYQNKRAKKVNYVI